jgi:hypothetical protein
MQRKLAHELDAVAKSTISADGVCVVGRDIPSGTYQTSGDSQCYYATLGSTDTSNIMDNNNFNGPETVDVSRGVRLPDPGWLHLAQYRIGTQQLAAGFGALLQAWMICTQPLPRRLLLPSRGGC